MSEFNGYYHDEEMSERVYNWIRACERIEAELTAKLSAAEQEVESQKHCYRLLAEHNEKQFAELTQLRAQLATLENERDECATLKDEAADEFCYKFRLISRELGEIRAQGLAWKAMALEHEAELMKIRAQLATAIEGFADANETIHGEYCGGNGHHAVCATHREALDKLKENK